VGKSANRKTEITARPLHLFTGYLLSKNKAGADPSRISARAPSGNFASAFAKPHIIVAYNLSTSHPP
jgi:hypothetical protein